MTWKSKEDPVWLFSLDTFTIQRQERVKNLLMEDAGETRTDLTPSKNVNMHALRTATCKKKVSIQYCLPGTITTKKEMLSYIKTQEMKMLK